MNVSFTQETRLGKLHTELGQDVLVLLRFSGADFVNGLFEYRVEALSTDPNLAMYELIGTHASVEFVTPDAPIFYDGVITSATNMGTGENGNRYDLVLRPWFWVAGKRRNQRIFHQKSVVDILKEVLDAYSGFSAPHLDDTQLTGSYDELEYTVQYRESDLAFCTRMMQAHGISYYFKHSEGSHTMHLTDDAHEHDFVEGEEREYYGVEGHSMHEGEHFSDWKPMRNFTTGAIRLTGFNFKTPDAGMEVDQLGEAEYAHGDIESFDFPGGYLDEGAGRGVASKRIWQERIKDVRHRAVGNCMSLSSGMKLRLTGDDLPRLDGNEFVCMRATHSYVSDSYSSGQNQDSGVAYTGTYEFIPLEVPLVPERTAPQPVVHGPQTAMVVGEGEIDCDEHGRILVKFHWDLNAAHSMRCRVSQSWAHKGYGSMIIPRIGMEVIVEFIEGDPSLPIVTGCVFNGKNTPPYALPANKTRSVWKTDSHEADGFNEVRFEDKGGEEEIWIHAQKDRNEKTLNNHTEEIDVDWSQKVGNDKEIEVGNDHTETIGNDEKRTTGNNQTVEVGVDHTEKIGKNRTETIGTDNKTTVGKNSTVSIGKVLKEVVGDTHNVQVGKTAIEKVGKDKSINVGTDLKITVGNSITISCGKGSISVKKDGTIAISGKKLSVDGDTYALETKKGSTIKAKTMDMKTSGKTVIKGSKVDMN